MEQKKISLELTGEEVFQLWLSVVSRIGFTNQLWASATSQEMQTNAQNQFEKLSTLATKINKILDEQTNGQN